MRVRLGLAYDGAGFAGWARQPGQRTVQDVVEQALDRLLPDTGRLTVAGRTDAGVHATGQVAHVDLSEPDWQRYAGSLHRRLSAVLPDDVRVTAAEPAPEAFDARFCALYREYRYRIGDAPWGVDPLRRHDTLAWPRPLDPDAMAAATAGLLGEHDFAAYCRRRAGATTVRALLGFDVERGSDGVIAATVRADAFCHSMVRSLIGALLAVGEGRRPVGWPAGLLAARQRAGDVAVAPAHGLTLVRVVYPPDDELAARAEATRRVRVLPGRSESAQPGASAQPGTR